MKDLAIWQLFHTSPPYGSRICFRPMKNHPNPGARIGFVRRLCDGKTEQEILEAEENFRNYLMLVKRIAERLEQEEQDNT